MKRGNVLVLGNSGVGKSTLINAVLGEELAETGWGTSGTTDKLTIYESEKIPFRIVDTIGFEPSWLKRRHAIHAVKKWSKDNIEEKKENRQIHVVWCCIEGTSSKLFPKTISDLSKAMAMLPSIPIIVVITKSYSVLDREKNIEMVKKVFAKDKKYGKNVREIIPVVSSIFFLNENAYAPPEGITELIDATNALMPEGVKASKKDIASFKLNRKRAMAHSVVGASTLAGVGVAATPIPIADALILSSIELALVNTIGKIYGIEKTEGSKKLFEMIVEVGTVSTAARGAISALKAIPGIQLGAGALNALIAGSVIVTLGEGMIYAFEQVYLGNKSISDMDWIKKVMETRLSSQFIEQVTKIVEGLAKKQDKKAIAKAIMDFATMYWKEKEKDR